jgi:nucleoside-diphosphate-sugar epimerase
MATKDTPQMHVLIVGCGDIGTRVAHLWQKDGATVTGIVRTSESLAKLQDAGISAVQCDLADSHAEIPDLLPNSLIYYFAPPPRKGRDDLHCQRLLDLLETKKHKPRSIVAISTTGVYGNRHGELVTEEDPLNPQVDRAWRRYDMENRLRKWCDAHDVSLVILRVGGIYGPGRLPLERIKKGIPIVHEHLAPKTNRIHADDLAMICKKAAHVSYRYRVYNVSDGQDSNMTEYFDILADHFGLPRPPKVDWDQAEKEISAGMLSYLKESRRLDNSRMLNELNINLRYPTLQDALKSKELDQTD